VSIYNLQVNHKNRKKDLDANSFSYPIGDIKQLIISKLVFLPLFRCFGESKIKDKKLD
jgi:hypothetical protein